jgi:glycosyltransferase involved in cell wall biosynthesis
LKITAAITTFNRIEALKNAIKSVENQTFLPIELIIIDDNSNDETQKFCENLTVKFPIVYLRNEKNSGAPFCRNLAIKHASGDYIAFLDDDDEWEPDKLLKQKDFAEKNFDLIYTAVSFGGKIHFHRKFPITLGNFAGITSTMMINLQILRKIDGFDEKLPALQDYDLVIRLIKNGAKVKGINIPLVKYQPSKNGNISGSPKNFFAAAKIILTKTSIFYKPLQFMGLSRIFAQKIVKSKEFRRKVFKRRSKK